MSEIKVQAYVPDEDYDNPAMVTDFYEFTMANCLFLHGYKDTVMVFDMFFRENPDDQGYDSVIPALRYHFCHAQHLKDQRKQVIGL